MRILGLDESIHDIREKLQEISGLPVVLGSSGFQPLWSEFTRTREKLAFFLPWALEVSTALPAKEQGRLHSEESSRYRDFFKSVNLVKDYQIVSVNVEGVDLDPVLLPFVRTCRHAARGRGFFKAIQFCGSEEIQAPVFVRREWELEGLNLGHKGTDSAHSLLPPGQHNGKEWPVAESWNRYMVVEKPPGECITCHGSSGETRHFGHVTFGPEPYATGLVCRACAKNTFEQWLKILNS